MTVWAYFVLPWSWSLCCPSDMPTRLLFIKFPCIKLGLSIVKTHLPYARYYTPRILILITTLPDRCCYYCLVQMKNKQTNKQGTERFIFLMHETRKLRSWHSSPGWPLCRSHILVTAVSPDRVSLWEKKEP